MILYFDCYAGISGDMTVAALLDLGVPLEYLRAELGKLGLPPASYELSTRGTKRHQMAALKFDVTVTDLQTHRSYADIDALIARSGLSEPVKEKSRSIFHRLAKAEALVHGVEIERIHFHEVGAIDSIVDIVGTAICLEYLKVKEVYFSALPLGSGFIETAHGRLSVPAPATAELLRGVPLHGECGSGERVTPTGAAVVAALASSFGKQPAMILEKTACGAGGKDFPDCPNILRAFLGKCVETSNYDESVMVVESNIDDSTPEIMGYAMERLFEKGALDVWFTPIQMKKNRPGVILSFLCLPKILELLVQVLLTETSAIGVRYHRAERTVRGRRIVEQQTEYGIVRFKEIIDNCGKVLRSSAEYEDCRRIARERGVPCRDVMEKLQSGGVSGV